jgi:multidrug efflux pump subunit AcrA (membrane-fusion protein)
MRNRTLIRVISSFTVALSCVFCIIATLALIIRADDAVEATGSIDADQGHIIRAASEGVIDSVFVRDGSEVKQGDAIASQFAGR